MPLDRPQHRRTLLVDRARPGRDGLRRLSLTACAWAGLSAVPALAQIYAAPLAPGDSTSAIVLSNFQTEQTPLVLVAAPLAAEARPAAPPQARAETLPGTAPLAPNAAKLGASPALTLSGPAIALRRPPAAPPAIAQLIAAVAAELDVAPNLLHAVIAAESGYDPKALSARGAMGLMQLMPATARRFGARDAYAPRDNVRAGAAYLKWLLAEFGGDLELALAAYNAGEQAVLKHGRRIPPYPETQAYVPRVIAYLNCVNDATCSASRVGRTLPPSAAGGRSRI
jgi:soluble lytic murein transglycosylase-like protein